MFGVYGGPKKVRFRVIADRSSDALLPIIQEWVAEKAVIVSDGWAEYVHLSSNNFVHKVLIYEREFVNEGWHTQAIKRAWAEGKAWLKRGRGGGPLLQSNLDELTWKMMNKNNEKGLLA